MVDCRLHPRRVYCPTHLCRVRLIIEQSIARNCHSPSSPARPSSLRPPIPARDIVEPRHSRPSATPRILRSVLSDAPLCSPLILIQQQSRITRNAELRGTALLHHLGPPVIIQTALNEDSNVGLPRDVFSVGHSIRRTKTLSSLRIIPTNENCVERPIAFH